MLKKLFVASIVFIASTAYGLNLPNCTVAIDGQIGREDGVVKQCVGASNTWISVDSDRYENVVTHGAVCDSTTDNTAAIEAAELAAATSGRVVFFPSCASGNTYVVDSSLVFDVPVKFNPGAILDNDALATVIFNNKDVDISPTEQAFVIDGG